MKATLRILFYFIVGIAALTVILSLLSLIYDVNLWYAKVLDFPRLQYLIIAIICLILIPFLKRKWSWPVIFLITGLCAAIVIQGVRIFPYFFGEKLVPDSGQQASGSENKAGILIANVLIDNKKANEFLQIVDRANPDVVLVMEVDDYWVKELESLENEFPYKLTYPLDNAYGIALYSKYALEGEQVLFLNHEDVPSIYSKIVLPSGKSFNFYGVHPVAPVPSEKYPDNKNDKEVALLKVGHKIAEDAAPAIVAGDFNDVSWSHTSRLFEQEGNLRNVRLGRGLYNTFDANSSFLRWPLDHFFVTKEFKLSQLERLQHFGSDHFPLYAEFVLD